MTHEEQMATMRRKFACEVYLQRLSRRDLTRDWAADIDSALAQRKQLRLSGKVSVGAYVRRRAM